MPFKVDLSQTGCSWKSLKDVWMLRPRRETTALSVSLAEVTRGSYSNLFIVFDEVKNTET